MDESQGLKLVKANNTHQFVQTIGESVTNRLNSNKAEYFVQSLFCTCQLNKADKQKILNCHKSSKQKMKAAIKRKMSYAQLEPPKKRKCLDMSRQYYMDKKKKVLTSCAETYHSMDADEKQHLFAKKRHAYQNMGSWEKEKLLVKQRNLTSKAKQTKATKCDDLNYCITSFQNKIREGTYYICSVCNRILYRKTVTELKKDKYSIEHLFTEKKSFDNQQYICKTCNSKMSKGQVPCQAVCNK